MTKNIFTTVLIFIAAISFGQHFTQLTNYQNPDFKRDKDIIIQKDSQIYRLIENNFNEVEVWQFMGDTMRNILISNTSTCEKGFYEWTTYKDYIIFFGKGEFILENIFTSEITEEVFINPDTIDSFPDFYIHQSKGLLYISVYPDKKHLYDIDHKEFVPIIEGSLAYKSDDFYYYYESTNHVTNLLRRPYNDIKADTVAVDLLSDLYKTKNNKFFCQQWDNTLIMIDKNDSICRRDYKNINLVDIIPIGNNRMFAFGIKYGHTIFFTFNENNLKFEDTISTSIYISNINFAFHYYFNKKILFSTCGATCYDSVLKLFDLETKKIIPDFELRGAVLKNPADSLVFIEGYYLGNPKNYVLNLKNLSLKPIPLNRYNHSIPFSLKYNDNCYLTSFKKGKGLVFSKYSHSDNSLTPSNAFIKRNLGVGKKLTLIDNILYFKNKNLDKTINFVDENSPGNIYIHKPAAEIISNIEYYEGKFYYFQKHGTQTNKCDLATFDPKTKITELFIKNIDVKIKSFSFIIKHGFIFLEINNNPFEMGNQYENWKIIDIKSQKLLTSDKMQVELLYNIVLSTKDYYYSYIEKQMNKRKDFKIERNNISNYEEIGVIVSYSKISMSQDTYSYLLNKNVFYCENDNCKKIGNVFFPAHILSNFLSPDKRYFGYLFNVKDNIKQIYIYDRLKGLGKTINLGDLGIDKRVIVSFIDNERLYLKYRFSATIPLFIYNFHDEKIIKFDGIIYLPYYLAVNSKEIHIWDPVSELIRIYDKNFNELETIQSDKFDDFHYSISSSLNDKIRVIFMKKLGELYNQSIITYNSTKREMKKYFSCEYNQKLLDVAIGDTTVYAIAKNTDSGYQIYKMDLQRNPVSIMEAFNQGEDHIKIFPNPVSNEFNIESDIPQDIYMTLYHADGTLMMAKEFNTATKVNVSGIPNGIYFATLKLKNKIVVKKIVITNKK